MITEPAPLVHVGFHRTASTWLQHSVFRAPGIGFGPPVPMGLLRAALVEPPSASFDPAWAADQLAPSFEAGRQPARAGGGPRVPVLSNERLTGYPHAGGRDAGELADRIAAAVPDARVLLVVREQRAVTLSCFRLYVKVGGGLPIQRYLHPPRGSATRIPSFDLRQFDYHHLIERYHRLFGADRVLTLAFEELVRAPAAAADRVADFAGAQRGTAIDPVARNAGLRGLGLELKRRANRHLVRHSLNPLGRSGRDDLNARLLRWANRASAMAPIAVQQRVESALAAAVEGSVAEESERIRASNRSTAALIGLDLGALGYLV